MSCKCPQILFKLQVQVVIRSTQLHTRWKCAIVVKTTQYAVLAVWEMVCALNTKHVPTMLMLDGIVPFSIGFWVALLLKFLSHEKKTQEARRGTLFYFSRHNTFAISILFHKTTGATYLLFFFFLDSFFFKTNYKTKHILFSFVLVSLSSLLETNMARLTKP